MMTDFPSSGRAKVLNAAGYSPFSGGGMLKLWFDWYIINYEKFFCCIRDQGLRVKMSIFVLRTFFQCSSPSSSLAGRGALRNSCPSCCEGDQKELGAKIESGGQFIPYGFYFRLRARRIITYRATKSPQQATKVAKSHPAEKTCNLSCAYLALLENINNKYPSAVRSGRKSCRVNMPKIRWRSRVRIIGKPTDACFAVFSSKYMYLHRVRPPLILTALEDKLQQGKNVASTLLVYKYHWMLCKDQYFRNPHFRRVR